MNIFDLTTQQIKTEFEALGLKSFRVKQVYKWMTKYTPVSEMSDLSTKDKEILSANFDFQPVTVYDKLISKDKSIKYIFKMSDGNIIEGALMRQSYGNTICISTQIGCRMGCAFCASGIGGLVRNLTAGEMLAQVLLVNKDLGECAPGK